HSLGSLPGGSRNCVDVPERRFQGCRSLRRQQRCNAKDHLNGHRKALKLWSAGLLLARSHGVLMLEFDSQRNLACNRSLLSTTVWVTFVAYKRRSKRLATVRISAAIPTGSLKPPKLSFQVSVPSATRSSGCVRPAW